MSWSVEFLPFVPWPVLWGLGAAGAVLLMLLFVYGYVHISYKRGRVAAGGGL